MVSSIDIEEGYQRVHKAFEHINFNAYDYDTIKKSLVEYLQINYQESFNDYIESSEIIAIIEAFAYVGELIAYRTDVNVHENFISQATRRDSILRLARLISYIPNRRESSRGLVRIDSISTSQSVKDTRGIELKNRVVRWNDSSNPNWQEQFFTIMQLILSDTYGLPSKSESLNGVRYDLYNSRISNLNNGVFPYTITTSQRNIRFELVPGAITSTGPCEQTPNALDSFKLFYVDDNLGIGSVGTGFMIYTVQGELVKNTYDFDQPMPNRKVLVPNSGVNNTDVYVIETDVVGSDTQLDIWNKVDSMLGENLYFNPSKNRKNYEVVTLDEDQIEIHFGDEQFAIVPIGPFNIWVRTADSDPITIPRSKFQQKEFSFSYYDKSAQLQTATMRFSLVNTMNNATSSEDIERIRTIAPSVYYTQDRMVNSRDYNEYLFQDPSILKLKAVNRTFSGASKYQRPNDASGSYQNIKLVGDDLRVYVNDGYESRIYNRGEGATEVQLIDQILEDILSKKEVKDHLVNVQGVVSPRSKFKEEVHTEFTYTGSSITSVELYPYPDKGNTQEKTEIQGRIDGKYYGALGTDYATYPADGLIHVDQNLNVYVLDFHIPASARAGGVTLSELVPGIKVTGVTSSTVGTVQSVYPVSSPLDIPATYAGYDATYTFSPTGIPTNTGQIWVDNSQIFSGYTVLNSTDISVSAVSATSISSIELRLNSVSGSHINSIDTWQFLGEVVSDGNVYVDNVFLSASNYNIVGSNTIDVPYSSASALQVVELRYTPVPGTDLGLSGDGTWTEEWQFIGTPKYVIDGTVYINGSPATVGVDYVIPIGTNDKIWTNNVSPTPVELRFADVSGVHTNHIAQWNFNPTTLGVDHASAYINVDSSTINTSSYTIVNASNIMVDASTLQTVEVGYNPNVGTYLSGIDRWEFNPGYDFLVDTSFAGVFKDDVWVNPLVTSYTLNQTTASTANIQIEANTIGTVSIELKYNEAGIMIVEASSAATSLYYSNFENVYLNSNTGNLNTLGGYGATLLSDNNILYTYQIQDGSGSSVGFRSVGKHVGAVNSGATSNDTFGIGYDRIMDQYYTISPEDLGPENAKYSREFARDVTGYNLDNSWLMRVKPIRSGGETHYLVGYRTVELISYGINKDFYYQNGRMIQNQNTGLVVEDTFTVMGVNFDTKEEYPIGNNILFPVVKQPIQNDTGKFDRRRLVIKEFDTNQDGIPDNRNEFYTVVDKLSPVMVLGLDGRGNDLEINQTKIARDSSSVYGSKPHTFTFDGLAVEWQEPINYYGDGAWKVSGIYNQYYPVTDGTLGNPTNVGAGSNLGNSIEYALPAGNSINGSYKVLFDNKEVPDIMYYLNASSIEIAFEAFMGYSTPTGNESLELKPIGIKTTLDDNLQLASTLNVPELTDFTIETIIRLDNTSGIDLYDGFHFGGYSTGLSTIEQYDRGWKLGFDSTVSGSAANRISMTFGSGEVTDASTWVTVSENISYTLPGNFNDKEFHHVAVERSTLLEYEKISSSAFNLINVGDRIVDQNGSIAKIWNTGSYDEMTSTGRLWIHDIKLITGQTNFGSINEPLVTNKLLPDGTYNGNSSAGFKIVKPAYRTLRFFVDGLGSSIINLNQTHPAAIDFRPVDTFYYNKSNLLSNMKKTSIVPVGETVATYAEGLTVSREARYGENFNDVRNPYKKFPRIFPQTVFFRRPNTLTDFEYTLNRPTPLEIVTDINTNAPENRLINEYIGRDGLYYLWTHFTPRSSLIDPSKTNIIDIFVHTNGFDRELKDWLDRNDIFEPMPVAPSANDLKVAYGKYLNKSMLSDTVIMHSGKIKYLFGPQAQPALRGKFRAIKKEESTTSDEQLKTLILEVIDKYFDINDWDFGRSFYATDLYAEIHKKLPKDIQSIVLVPSYGTSKFGDLHQIDPEDDEILQSAAKITDIEIIAGITKQNIRRSDE